MFCWHKWSKWTVPVAYRAVGGYIGWWQTKECSKCGKVKRRTFE